MLFGGLPEHRVVPAQFAEVGCGLIEIENRDSGLPVSLFPESLI